MQEFSSISVSSYEAGSLAERLTEQSRDGWSVVTIVPTGSTVTAYLCRDAADAAPAGEPEPDLESHGAADTEAALAALVPDPVDAPSDTFASYEDVAEPVQEPAVEATPEPAASEPVESTASPSSATESAVAEPATTEPATTEPATTEPATTESTTAAAGAAPAGWYADPSGRFELRYWDGGQWTEHVSRAGQQYTDPPVA